MFRFEPRLWFNIVCIIKGTAILTHSVRQQRNIHSTQVSGRAFKSTILSFLGNINSKLKCAFKCRDANRKSNKTWKRNYGGAIHPHLGNPVVGVPAPVDPVLQELDALEQVVLEGGRALEHVHPGDGGERRGEEVQAVVGQVQAVVLPLLDYVLKHLRVKKGNTWSCQCV